MTFLIKYLQCHRLFEILLRNADTVYFHCSAEKDRTGIDAFLVMVALGMSAENVIKEHLLSNQCLKNFADLFYQQYPIFQDYQNEAEQLLLVNRG